MDKNENNNLIDADTENDNDNDNENDNLPPPQILLSPEQQKKLEEHLTPPSQSISDNYYNNNNNNNKFELSRATDNNEGSGDEKEKKKKKKDKKKNKNKNKSTDNEEEDIDEVIIKSPILLKSRKSVENQHHDPYSTEMSPVNNGGHIIPQSSTPQIELDPEVYFDASKKEKKKKKKNGGGGGNKDKFLTPEERRIKENSKDAKSFFSNERTFLSWIGLTFSLGAIGTAIITWFGSEGVSLATGVFLWAIAMVFMVYSTLQFRRRGHAIRTKTQGPFDDQKGPLSLVAMVVVGVSIYLVFFVVIRPTVNIGGETNPSGNNSTKGGL